MRAGGESVTLRHGDTHPFRTPSGPGAHVPEKTEHNTRQY